MKTISVVSLSGGQGKTTLSLFLARLLAQAGYEVLAIDGDPQGNLSRWFDVNPSKSDPTLLEVIKGTVSALEAVYPVKTASRLTIIPADNNLYAANNYLQDTGYGANVLRQRLESLANEADFCIIDSPPQRSQLTLTIIGAADYIVVPVEASRNKGVLCLQSTLELLALQNKFGSNATLLAVVPFRDKWNGRSQVLDCRKAIDRMKELAGAELLTASVLDRQGYNKAIDAETVPSEIGEVGLEYPFQEIIERITKPRVLVGV